MHTYMHTCIHTYIHACIHAYLVVGSQRHYRTILAPMFAARYGTPERSWTAVHMSIRAGMCVGECTHTHIAYTHRIHAWPCPTRVPASCMHSTRTPCCGDELWAPTVVSLISPTPTCIHKYIHAKIHTCINMCMHKDMHKYIQAWHTHIRAECMYMYAGKHACIYASR